MSVVYLGLGSNSAPADNLVLCARALRGRFDLRVISSVYRNQAVGFEGDDFLNAVACLDTSLTPVQVCDELEQIHTLAGRQRGVDSFASRTLDIDLLLYDSQVIDEARVRVPRADILKYSFVLRPLAEIAPKLIHPLTGKSIARHWAEFAAESHPLALEHLDL